MSSLLESTLRSQNQHLVNATNRISELERELQVANNWVEHHQNHCDDLIRENAALRKDKERLDWLLTHEGGSWLYFESFDKITRAAIDAARKEVKP